MFLRNVSPSVSCLLVLLSERIRTSAKYEIILKKVVNPFLTKVRSLFKDGKQTAGCTEFRTETGLHSLVSVQKFVHPAVCLPSSKRERTLESRAKFMISRKNFSFNENSLIHPYQLVYFDGIACSSINKLARGPKVWCF